MSAPGSSLPPRPAHLPAPPAFPPPPPPPSSRSAAGYGAELLVEPSRRDDYRAYDDRKRRRSDASDDRRESRPRIDDREERMRLSAPPMRNPEELETLVSKADWHAWFRSKHAREVAEDDALERLPSAEGMPPVTRGQRMQDRYEAYRKRFVSRQLYALFLVHKPSAWFEERYSMTPENVAMRERVQKQARDGLAEQFIAEVNDGRWDAISYDLAPDGVVRTELAGTSLPELEVEAGQVAVYPAPNQLRISALPVDATRAKLEEACGKLAGFKRLSLGPALEENRFIRSAWVDLEAGTDLAAAAAELDGQKLPGTDIALQVSVNDKPVVGKPKLAPEGSGTAERLQKDLEQARQLILLLQAETDGTSRTAAEHDGLKAIDSKMASLAPAAAADGLEDAEGSLRRTKLHLDLYLTYLRRVFHTCYYSGSISDSREELEVRSLKYLRKVPSTLPPVPPAAVEAVVESKSVKAEDASSAKLDALEADTAAPDAAMEEDEGDIPRRRNDDDEPSAAPAVKTAEQQKADSAVASKLSDLNSLIWSQGVDSRIERLLTRSTTDPVTVGGKSLEQEQDRIVSGFIKHEDEGKFRCKECLKLFKAAEFVKKHVPNKHPELLKPLDIVRFFNSFVLDPLHVMPPAGAPASVNDQLPVIRAPAPPQPPPGFPPGTQFPAGFVAPWMNPMLAAPPGQGMMSTGYTPGFLGMNFGGLNPYLPYSPMPGITAMGGIGGRGRQGGAGGGPGNGRFQGGGRRSDQPGGERPPPVDTTIGRPAGVRDDPRASKGRLSYNDLDANVPDGGDEVKLDY